MKSATDTHALPPNLDRVQELENKWRMEFYPSKCHVLQITNRRSKVPAAYHIHNQAMAILIHAKT
jgi:hypothetical protein